MLLNQQRAVQTMADAGVDVLIATDPSNVAYLSDYLCTSHRITPGVQVYGILPREKNIRPGLVIPSLEVDSWAEQPGAISEVSVYGTLHRDRETSSALPPDDQLIFDYTMARDTFRDAIEALQSALERRGLDDAVIGLDESNVQPTMWTTITGAFPRAKVVPAASLFRQIRLIKTAAEIERMARSAEITELAIKDLWAEARAGVTERELAARFKARVAEMDADPGFWIISAGRRTAHTHARQSDYRVRDRDLIKLDVGCTYAFYWSDVGRTKSLGTPGERENRIYETLCAGLRAATSRVRPGVRASELFDTAVGTIRDGGIPNYQRHHCGHGIGITVYDPPLIQPRGYRDIFGIGGADPALEVGMVINLETPYYVLGEFGFIVEDTMVVREDGPELLTHLDHSLAISN